MFQAKVAEEIKAHILCSTNLFEGRAVCEIMWENIAGVTGNIELVNCMLGN
jgi:hypothetical protein